MSSGGLAEHDGVSNLSLQVRGHNVSMLYELRGAIVRLIRRKAVVPGGKQSQHILYASHLSKSTNEKVHSHR
jgi:hypothetical protein